MLDALDGSDYKEILEPFEKTFHDNRSNLYIEAALYRYFYDQVSELTIEKLKGKHLERILDVFRIQSDMRTIVNIYRLKRFLNADDDLLRQFMIPDISNLKKKQLAQLINAPTAEEVLKRLNLTPYGRLLEKIDFNYIEGATQKILYSWNLKTFRFSSDPTVVMFCYISLAENEINNITHIIEGVRYNVPADEIREMLIGAGN